MKLVTEVTNKYRRKLVWQRIQSLFGSLLILIGLLLLIPVVVMLLLIIAIPNDLAGAWSAIMWFVPSFGLLSAAVIAAGLRIKRKQGRLVLFLRRFGFSGSSRALTFAVSTAIGKRWRLVTLDDASITPLGVLKRTRGLLIVSKWFLLLLVLAGVIYLVYIFHIGGFEHISKNILDTMLNNDTVKDRGIFEELILTLLLAIMSPIIALLIIIPLYLITALIIPATFYMWGASRAVKKAERRKAIQISDQKEIETSLPRLFKKKHRIFSPRLVVVKVANNIWQQVVIDFSVNADIILIDVSEPTENLLWEISMLKDKLNSNWIFVGNEESLRSFIEADPGKQSSSVGKLLSILDQEEVLAYESADHQNKKRFARALQNQLVNRINIKSNGRISKKSVI